jgi:uncharacterized protein YndB with AHSA1/START domain
VRAGRAAARSLDIVRTFDAPREVVFAMWATPEHMAKWSAPMGFTISNADMDFREGGRWFCHMRAPDGVGHKVQGEYLEIVEGRRIVMTHAWLDDTGRPGPETRVSVQFLDDGSKTKMSFSQTGFTSAASRDGHGAGWSECFDLLAAHLLTLSWGQPMVPPANTMNSAAGKKETTMSAASDAETQDEKLIGVSRLISAPRKLVFKAFKDPKHITHWWGPNGFSTTTDEMDFRVGGKWRFTMHGPDGTNYPNFTVYTAIREPEIIAYDHYSAEGSPLLFKAAVEFVAEGNKTRVTLRMTFATAEQRAAMAKFGAIEGGEQTLARLDSYISQA